MKKIDFIPADGRYLIRRSTPDEVTKGGLLIPQVGQAEKFEGVIVAVPESCRTQNGFSKDPRYKLGSYVLYSKFGGTVENIDGEQLTLLHEDEILGEFPGKRSVRVTVDPEVRTTKPASEPGQEPGQPTAPSDPGAAASANWHAHLNWTDKVERPPAEWDTLSAELNQRPALPPPPADATIE